MNAPSVRDLQMCGEASSALLTSSNNTLSERHWSVTRSLVRNIDCRCLEFDPKAERQMRYLFAQHYNLLVSVSSLPIY
jgi:hypothetical protein